MFRTKADLVFVKKIERGGSSSHNNKSNNNDNDNSMSNNNNNNIVAGFRLIHTLPPLKIVFDQFSIDFRANFKARDNFSKNSGPHNFDKLSHFFKAPLPPWGHKCSWTLTPANSIQVSIMQKKYLLYKTDYVLHAIDMLENHRKISQFKTQL